VIYPILQGKHKQPVVPGQFSGSVYTISFLIFVEKSGLRDFRSHDAYVLTLHVTREETGVEMEEWYGAHETQARRSPSVHPLQTPLSPSLRP
jgi:hypothetical protein